MINLESKTKVAYKSSYLVLSVIILFFTIPYIYYYYIRFDRIGIISVALYIFKLFYIGSFITLIALLRFRLLKVITAVLLFFPYLTELISVYVYHDFLGASATLSFLNTTKDEFLVFSKGLWFLGSIIIVFYFLISVIFVRLQVNIKKEKRIAFLLFSFFSVFAISGNVYLSLINSSTKKSVAANFKKEIIKQYPINFYYRIYELFLIQHNMAIYKNEIDNYSFYAIDSDTLKNKVYVFVIGESQRYDIYFNELRGKQNNRILSKKNTNILHKFYSTGNFTAICVPMMLTRANTDSCGLCYREPSVAEVFKEAGYKTYWISNQNLFVGPPVNIFKDNIDEFYPLYDKHKNDKIILPVLKKVLTDNYDKKFIIINLLGNHKYKYPDTYNIYTPNLRTENVSQVSIGNKDLFVNSYKNQTNFELEILDQIISEIDRNNLLASLVFASDHGESLFDAPGYYFGHGSVNVPIEQTHIFSFIWMSDRYIKTFPDKKELLNINYNKLTNTDCLFYTMADIANISFPKMDKSKSLVKQEYRQLNSIRVIGGDMKIHKIQ